MAPTPAARDSPSGRGADILTAAEFCVRVHIRKVQTVTDLCAAGLVPGASKIGHEWRIHWRTFYAALAGPGVPDGEVVTSTELARRLGVSSWVVRRASAAPGTPGKLPGMRLGKTWLYAQRAVDAQTGWSYEDGQDAAVPGPQAAGPSPAQQAGPATSQPARSLEYPAPAAGQAPTAHGVGTTARHRRPRPSPGSNLTPH